MKMPLQMMGYRAIFDFGFKCIVKLPIREKDKPTDEQVKHLEFIVRACNAHADLVKALDSALRAAEFEKHAFRPWHDQAREALAKALGSAA